MDTRQLAYFVAVYEQRSISAAARQLDIAQPSVSSALQQLEQQLGTLLFIRLPKGVQPTEDAERLYVQACQLLSQMQALQASFNKPAKRLLFRLGLVKALGVERMSQLLKEFNSQLPGLELHLVEPDEPCDARIINIRQLKAGELYQPLWTDSYVLALPAQHPLCTQAEIQLADFKKLPLIKRTPCEAWDQVALALSKANIKPQIRANIHTIEYAIGLVGAGIGCALLPDFEMQKFRPDLQYRAIQGPLLTRELVLAFDKNQQHQIAVKLLCEIASRSS
ncbi:LysR family transcriptional regulator [Rheinheimera texasensis]|uniref:LysR family transcriptional regulator n=1 Tax=Rheinheimera texasensis TaxID=306205 RepID=UPI0032B18BC6